MNTLTAKEVVAGSLGYCYLKVNGSRYEWANVIKIEATMEKQKASIPVLGKSGKLHKTTGWEGTGTMTLHYNTSVLRKLAQTYKLSGADTYFTIELTVNDPSTTVGSETIFLKDCNFDSLLIANVDAEADYLQEDVDFTFDDFEFKSWFSDPRCSEGFGTALTEAGLAINKGLSIAGTVGNIASSVNNLF